jgi:hypothetical protein
MCFSKKQKSVPEVNSPTIILNLQRISKGLYCLEREEGGKAGGNFMNYLQHTS